MRKKMLANGGVLACICFVGACVNFKVEREYLERRAYMVELDETRAASRAPLFGTVVVRRFDAAPGFADRGFVYRTVEGTFESDYYNEFFVEPGAMIRQSVEAWLAGSGLFTAVADAESAIDPMYVLEGRIEEIYGDYSRSGPPDSVLDVRFTLTGPEGVELQRSYEERVQAGGDEPRQLVGGWEEALKQILDRFESDLRELGRN